MKFQLHSKSDQYAKLKIGVIPVLFLALGYVLFMPKEKPQVLVAVQKTEAKTDTIVNRILTTPNKNKSDKKQGGFPFSIPKISLAEMSAHDPFELLAVLRPEVVPELQNPELTKTEIKKNEALTTVQVKESLKSHLVQGIFISGDKKIALIDSKVYHEGDFLEEGVLVLQISTHHVVLELASKDRITL